MIIVKPLPGPLEIIKFVLFPIFIRLSGKPFFYKAPGAKPLPGPSEIIKIIILYIFIRLQDKPFFIREPFKKKSLSRSLMKHCNFHIFLSEYSVYTSTNNNNFR